MPGELPENTWMSEEIVSGMQPCCIAASATVKSKLPPPWPMSKSTPRFFAASASGRSFPSWTMLVNLPALFGAPEKQCLGMREAEVEEVRLGEAGVADVRDMHEGVEARARLRRDVAPEGGESVRAGVAGVDHRRRALERDQLVRRDADRRAVRIDVRVQ